MSVGDGYRVDSCLCFHINCKWNGWINRQRLTLQVGESVYPGVLGKSGRSNEIADILIFPSPISFWFFVGFRWDVNTKS